MWQIFSTIYKAEYSLDGGEWTVVDPVGKLSDSQSLDYELTLKNLSRANTQQRCGSQMKRQHGS